MRTKWFLALLLTLCMMSMLLVIGCDGDEKVTPKPEQKEQVITIEPKVTPKPEQKEQVITGKPSIAQKLATVNKGSSVKQDDPVVGEFETYLFLIEKKVTQNESEVADILVKVWELIEKKKPLLDVFKEIEALLPDLEERNLLEEATKYVKAVR